MAAAPATFRGVRPAEGRAGWEVRFTDAPLSARIPVGGQGRPPRSGVPVRCTIRGAGEGYAGGKMARVRRGLPRPLPGVSIEGQAADRPAPAAGGTEGRG